MSPSVMDKMRALISVVHNALQPCVHETVMKPPQDIHSAITTFSCFAFGLTTLNLTEE